MKSTEGNRLGGPPAGPDDDERFADWVDDRMSERERERFAAELRVNPQLRARLEAYQRTIASVQQALRAPLGKVEVAGRVMARIAGGERASPPARGGAWMAGPRSLWLSAAVAASVFALLALLIEWQPVSQRLDVAVAPQEAAPPAAAKPATNPTADPDDPLRGVDLQHFREARADAAGGPVADRSPAKAPAEAPAPAETRKEEEQAKAFVATVTGEVSGRDGAAAGTASGAASADAVRRFEELVREQARSQAPIVTAATMLPQVRLQRQVAATKGVVADKATGDLPQRQRAPAGSPVEQFFDAESSTVPVDLTQALPAGGLTVQRLLADPGQVPAGSADANSEAWLVEGSQVEVFAYLARLSAEGRQFGYQVTNGEVPAGTLLALIPPAPLGQYSNQIRDLRDELAGVGKDLAGNEPQDRLAGRKQDVARDSEDRVRKAGAADEKPLGAARGRPAASPPSESAKTSVPAAGEAGDARPVPPASQPTGGAAPAPSAGELDDGKLRVSTDQPPPTPVPSSPAPLPVPWVPSDQAQAHEAARIRLIVVIDRSLPVDRR